MVNQYSLEDEHQAVHTFPINQARDQRANQNRKAQESIVNDLRHTNKTLLHLLPKAVTRINKIYQLLSANGEENEKE